jgi:hypothetical protein
MISKTPYGAVALCLFAWLTCGLAATAETIFVDRFVDGNAEDGIPATWVPQLGAWDASTGDYVASGPSPKITLVPEHVLTDTSIRAQVRAGGNVGVGLGVRRGLGPVGYAGVLLPDGTLGFNRVDGAPVPVILGFARVPLNLMEQDVMLQVDAFGSELSIWASHL